MILPFGYIANRYLADALPFLAVAGLVGRPGGPRRGRGAPPGGSDDGSRGSGSALSPAGFWINLSHGLLFQRLYSPNVKDDLVAGFLDTRYDVGQRAGLDPPIPIMEVGEHDDLPLDVPRGQVAVVGECKAMYLSDGLDLNAVKFTPWNPIERIEAGGRYLVGVDFPIQPPGTRLPLFSMHSPRRRASCTPSGAAAPEWCSSTADPVRPIRVPRGSYRPTTCTRWISW